MMKRIPWEKRSLQNKTKKDSKKIKATKHEEFCFSLNRIDIFINNTWTCIYFGEELTWIVKIKAIFWILNSIICFGPSMWVQDIKGTVILH